MLNQMFINLSQEYKGEETNADYKRYFDNGYQDIVIAHIYKLHYQLFNRTIITNYYGIDEMEAEHIKLTQIWKCLEGYDETKSNGKITTMICTYIRNACRAYTQAQNSDKRKVGQSNVTSNFSEFEKTDFLEKDYVDNEFNRAEVKQYLKQLNLTENQYKFCMTIIDSPDDTSLRQIALEIGMSRAGVSGLQRQLKQILVDLM